jgi:hypothetical protein
LRRWWPDVAWTLARVLLAFGERLRGYLALVPVFWLGVLLTEGLRRATSGALEGSLINDLEPNQLCGVTSLVARLASDRPDPVG